jgi:aminoglycoside phosphotransferase (APT) family kinase protein
MSLSLPDIQRGLLAFYHAGAPMSQTARLLELHEISDGWENEVYSFALADATAAGPAREELILRIYPGNDGPQKAAREFEAMRRLRLVGFPVPQVLWLELDPSWLGRPFVIMEKIPGRSITQVFLASAAERQQELLALCGRLLVDLHALKWQSVVTDDALATAETPAIMQRELVQAQAHCRSLHQQEFDAFFEWLRERFTRVRWGPPCLVHRDYHGENILLRDDGAAFVIDWGNIRVSDRRTDLGWTLLLSSTYGTPEMRPLILQAYERSAGCQMEDLDYFDVVACLRRLSDISGSLDQGATQLGMRPGAEEMMRNAPHIQSVYAVLLERTGIRIPQIEALLATLS